MPADRSFDGPQRSHGSGVCASFAAVGAVDLGAAWQRHVRWLRTVLAARGVDRCALEEVLQNVAAAASASLHRLRDPSKTGPWLYRIAVLQALLHRRQRGRQRRLLQQYGGSACSVGRDGAASSTTLDPLGWLVSQEQRTLVRQALADLSRRDAEILLLKYTEDWSYRELAEHLGLSESAVEARLHRARQRMRLALKKRNWTEGV